ncbi:MAG: pilus assembly protein [Rhodobacteraceae bacterium]|nr:pilus assembly protein [Paracoccaceae bacterium]
MRKLGQRLRAARRSEAGNATVEFVIVFPIFMMIFFQSFEAGWLMVRDTMLERALDLTVRDLRLGHMTDPTNATIRSEICTYTTVIADCNNSVMVELTPVDTGTWAMPSNAATCVNRGATVQPVTTVQQGVSDQMMLIRVCAIIDPLFPGTKWGLNLPVDSTGGYALIATTAFVNEPT